MRVPPTLMKSSNGESVVVQEGESTNLRFVPTDLDGAEIIKANLITMTITIFDFFSSTVVNSRNAQNVIDANDGMVDTAGVLTLRLQPADTAVVGAIAAGAKQIRCVVLIWTFNDGVAVRTCKSDPLGFEIQKLATVT